MRKLRIGVIWANPYSKNLGVAALAYSALVIIKDILDEQQIKTEFSFIGSSKTEKDDLYINDKSYVFKNILGLDYFSIKSILKMMIHPKKNQLNAHFRFDYIFDMGEGDSFSDIYGDVRFNKIANSKRFFSLLQKKQFLLPQTVGPFKKKKNELKALSVLKKMDKVVSRDKQSYDFTVKYLNANNVQEAIDLAFYLPFNRVLFRKDKINVGINVSGLLWHGGYTKNNQFNLKTNYQNLIRKVINYFLTEKNVQIYLVPHVVPKKEHVENDISVSKLLKKEYPGVEVAPYFNNPIEAKSYISGLDFFTGARMHSCIAAFSSGVPVCPMAYSRKFNGLFRKTLNYDWLGDCVNDVETDVYETVISSFLKRKELKEQIEDTLKSVVKERIELLKNTIKEFVK